MRFHAIVAILFLPFPVLAQGTVYHLTTGNPPTVVSTISVDSRPLGVGITPDGARAYVANNGSGTVVVIGTDPSNPQTLDRVLDRIGGFCDPEWPVIRADGWRGYVTDEFTDELVVIDTDPLSATFDQVLQKIKVGHAPEKVALGGRIADGNLVAYTGDEGDSFTAVDVQPGSRTENIVIGGAPLDGRPEAVVMVNTVNGPYLYITLEALGEVAVIAPIDDSIATTLEVEDYPEGIAATPDGAWVLVTNANSASVTVIDTSTNTPFNRIAVGNGPQGIAVSPDGTVAYVANYLDGTISVIDVQSQTEVTRVSIRRGLYGVAFTPDGASAYVTDVEKDETELEGVCGSSHHE